MLREATATLLLGYLSWAAIGSVFAGEHVHTDASGVRVHSHSLSWNEPGHSHDRFYHHDRDDRLHQHRHHERPAKPGDQNRQGDGQSGDRHHESETDSSEQSGDESNDADSGDANTGLNAPPHNAESLLARLATTTPLERPRLSLAPGDHLTVFTAAATVAGGMQEPDAAFAHRIRDGTAAWRDAALGHDRFARPPPHFV